MDSIFNLIVPVTAEFSYIWLVQVLARLIVLMLSLETFGVVCAHLGKATR